MSASARCARARVCMRQPVKLDETLEHCINNDFFSFSLPLLERIRSKMRITLYQVINSFFFSRRIYEFFPHCKQSRKHQDNTHAPAHANCSNLMARERTRFFRVQLKSDDGIYIVALNEPRDSVADITDYRNVLSRHSVAQHLVGFLNQPTQAECHMASTKCCPNKLH